MRPDITIEAFVLAGGKSTRMGRDKGLISLGGKPMISYILETLRKVKLPVSIIANSRTYKDFGVEVHPDLVSGKGPMGGLLTAFEYTDANVVLLVSCDMPLIPVEAVKQLLHLADKKKIVAPVLEDKINPLFALYPCTLKRQLEENIASQRLKMIDFVLENKHTLISSMDRKAPWRFRNVNDLSQLKEMEERWESPE